MHTWSDVITRANSRNPEPPQRVEKTDDGWRALLQPEVYRITRRAHTEPAFSSEMCGLFEPGQYQCVCCATPLFAAENKFRSASGWPSFTRPIADAVVAYQVDRRHDARSIEATCNVCDAHLGHVFPDGPAPSGLRYCMNALALVKPTENL